MFDSDTVRETLARHPRLTTSAFAVVLLLMQAGNVAAGGGANSGPGPDSVLF
jgi:hypothetical protein